MKAANGCIGEGLRGLSIGIDSESDCRRGISRRRRTLHALVSVLMIMSTSLAAQTRDVGIDAVRQCLTPLQENCSDYLSVQSVNQVDRQITGTAATVIARINFRVTRQFDGDAGGATRCTGTTWDMDPKKVRAIPRNIGGLGVLGGTFLVGQELQVEKSFQFQKFESGWRCATTSMFPVIEGRYMNNLP